jgi:hypothetical protein
MNYSSVFVAVLGIPIGRLSQNSRCFKVLTWNIFGADNYDEDIQQKIC